MPTFYDDALPRFAAIIERTLGEDHLYSNVFLRDGTGRLIFVLRSDIGAEKIEEIKNAAKELYPYVASAEDAIATPSQLFDESLLDANAGRIERIEHTAFSGFVRIVERRIVGQDWLSEPREPILDLPPVVVFASYKGGVGRSTSLAVAASHFANLGLNILAIDLDLEAPGIGGMLLDEESMPEFGTLDFFVENGLQETGNEFFQKMVGVSKLTRGRGIVHVIPAIGRRSKTFPQNVIGKLSRAYLDDPQKEGQNKTFLDQARDLLSGVAGNYQYDAIFVDARAGLNETTAAAILGLGADVLLFAVNTPQIFEGYRYLLSHLGTFDDGFDSAADWRFRIKMVHAKASANTEEWKSFRDSSFELFSAYFYELDEGGDSFNFDIDDSDAPHAPWPILNDTNYLEFDPLKITDQLAPNFYERTFGPFLSGLKDRLDLQR